MGSLYRRGNIWWMKYYRNGRPIRESTGLEQEKEAKRFLKQREGDIASGRVVIPRMEKIRFENLAEDYLNDYRVNGKRSLDQAERNVRHLAEFFAGRRVVAISTADIRTYIDRRQKAGTSNATKRKDGGQSFTFYTLSFVGVFTFDPIGVSG